LLQDNPISSPQPQDILIKISSGNPQCTIYVPLDIGSVNSEVRYKAFLNLDNRAESRGSTVFYLAPNNANTPRR